MMQLGFGPAVKLDKKDKAILEQLQKDCRQTIARLAKKTGLPRDVIVYRIKKMESQKVIRGHHTAIDPTRIGYPLYAYLLIACYNIKPDTETSLISWLKANPQVVYLAKNSGRFDFTIGVCAKDYRDFDELIRTIRHRFADSIREIESLPTIQEYKFDYMADLIETK